ncbi:amidase [Rhizobium sp.]
MTDITSLSATDLSSAIHRRELTCVAVMQAYLDRIGAINPVINAIVNLRDADALISEAHAADRELIEGDSRGFLHGMPFAIKDLSEAKGLPCTYGSPLTRNFVPDFDDIHVGRIRAAGAIFIGKTNVPEKGLGSHSYNPIFGTTRNPYDRTKSAGGSSGGAAAGLAARILPLADGSDMMGSLRNPAGFNNVIGFRPSFGRVPALDNEIYMGQLSTNGPMGRTVADVAALLDIQSGYDFRDPLSLPKVDVTWIKPLDAKRLKIGWLGDYGGYLPFGPGMLDLCEQALETFRSLGASVEKVEPAFDMARLWTGWKTMRHFLIANSNAADYADLERRAALKPELLWEIENGRDLRAADVHAASVIRSDWYRHVLDLFERYDFLILPSAQVFPFDAEQHWPKEIAGRGMDTYHRWMEVVIGPSMIGLPVAALPAGFGADGLPAGIQIIGPPRADRRVLEIALTYEHATDWLARTPEF